MAKTETETPRRNPWPLRVLGLLLLVQGLGLGFLAQVTLPPQIDLGVITLTELSRLLRELLPAITYSLGAFIALLVAVDFWRRQPNAWHFAMLVQGLTLLAALLLYVNSRPTYLYVMLAYALAMVLYLHNHEVQDVFHTRAAPAPPVEIE